jgi:hypothetical protein
MASELFFRLPNMCLISSYILASIGIDGATIRPFPAGLPFR